MRKNNQTGRILIKCSSDAKIFSSDVYKKHTQAKKHRLDVPQFGRSMVEMLGVLAIIGVLSVGAIAGYQKAMMKYKLNKHAESMNILITNAIQNIKTFEKDKDNTVTYYGKMFNKLNLIPSTMKYINNSSISDIFSNRIEVYSNNLYYGIIYNMNKSNYNTAICMNLFEVAKANIDDLKIVQFTYQKEAAPEEHQAYAGNLSCNAEQQQDNQCLKNKKLTDFKMFANAFLKNKEGYFI